MERGSAGTVLTACGSLSNSKSSFHNVSDLLHKPSLQVKTLIELNSNLKETSEKMPKGTELLWRKEQPEERFAPRRTVIELSKRLDDAKV